MTWKTILVVVVIFLALTVIGNLTATWEVGP